MKLAKFANTKAGMVAAVAVVGVVVVYLAEKKAREAAADIGQAINPVNNDNIFASGVDSVGSKLTGNENFKLGSWIYDQFHDKYDPNAPSNASIGVWAGLPKI